MEHVIKPIAYIKSDFKSKFGIPRQAGLCEGLESLIIFEKEYRREEAVRGLEAFSHIWLIWQFSESLSEEFSPTVRPPRMGGNKRVGVFATRSPNRPNSLGLSAVKLLAIESSDELGPVLRIEGADLMDGTPIFDIKPYLSFVDAKENCDDGFAADVKDAQLEVDFPEELLALIPEEKRRGLISALEQDPRPHYQNDPERIYGFPFSDFEIRFRVSGDILSVCEVEKIKHER